MKIIHSVILFFIILSPCVAAAYPIACGIPPISPVGCYSQCICDGNGECQWVFNCR